MPKRTSAADIKAPYRVTIVTLDGHLASAVTRATKRLRKVLPGLELSLFFAGEWAHHPERLDACRAHIAEADLVIASMLFMEDHINAVVDALSARRDQCDAMVCFMSDAAVMKLTRVGQFSMDGEARGPIALLKRLRGGRQGRAKTGEKQARMLKRLPRILKYIPGTAQDVRAYFLTMQYWLAGSDDNLANMVALLIDRYGQIKGRALRGSFDVAPPQDYPDTGVYHPELNCRVSDSESALPATGKGETVGLLLMRSYVLAGNALHYDAVIHALEARGFRVIPAFASGLDARPAVRRFFMCDGKPVVDCVVSLTGFSLVGGPAYNDASAAEEMLADLDVPYIAAHATEFQTLEQWSASDRGLMPVETTMMVAIPELDGAIAPTLFAGRSIAAEAADGADMFPQADRIKRLADRVQALVRLRRTPRSKRRLGIVLFNFPPNTGATGTAAFLSVFESLYQTLHHLADAGYDVELPVSVDALRESILQGNAAEYGTDANVLAHIPVDDYVASAPWLEDVEAAWGPAPGRSLANGDGIFILGRQLGDVTIAVQPPFGYEGDPMRLLFERGHAPTHAFCAFYQYLQDTLDVHALLNFGTHGALEFMPGKQVGLSGDCWPERLLGALPNFYLYAANNPSEATLAKRRSAATMLSYLTPAVSEAGLYRSLSELRASINRWRGMTPVERKEAEDLLAVIQQQAEEMGLPLINPSDPDDQIDTLRGTLDDYEQTLIPTGMHVIGKPMAEQDRQAVARAMWSMLDLGEADDDVVETLTSMTDPAALAERSGADVEAIERIQIGCQALTNNHDAELDAIVHALDGGFIRPVAGGDLLKDADVLPTGRNVHGFDPSRLPSVYAQAAGARHAELLLQRHQRDTGALPESIAFVLWGTDNLKTEGVPIAQALALLGARARYDNYGRLTGATLIPLEELARPRIDVLMTLSGIFRDLMPAQIRLLAEAALLAAEADEPLEQNFVRKHTLEYQANCGCDFETAALRVFSNADGAYGSNVNHLIDQGSWGDEDELAETYTRRKCFAFGRDGIAARQSELLQASLSNIDLAYQNIESVELGVTSIDNYFDTLGGISSAAQRAQAGASIDVYIGDQSGAGETVRTLTEQVALETHTRMLNPAWYESLLDHGYEGVRQIESHVTNTMGLSATTGKVDPSVYQQLTHLYVLDPEMRERLAELNPVASARVAGRLLEAHERDYWSPDQETLAELQRAGDELDDRLEGINEVAIA